MRSVERASAGCWDRDEQDRHCFGAIASLSCYQFMKVKGLGLDQVGLEWKGYRERITLEESRKQPWHQTWPWANHISHWASFSPVKWRYCSLIAKVYFFFQLYFVNEGDLLFSLRGGFSSPKFLCQAEILLDPLLIILSLLHPVVRSKMTEWLKSWRFHSFLMTFLSLRWESWLSQIP